jgi:hypothetical protein
MLTLWEMPKQQKERKKMFIGKYTLWRAPKSRGETNLRVSQSQVAEVETW